MPLPLLAAAGVSLIPSAFKAISGILQGNQANKIKPVDPGYQMNNQVIDNARILGDRYGNYQMPGYNQALDNINQTGANGFYNASQGATSGGDILDAATRIAYGQNQATNQLAVQNAQGKEGALQDYLGANAAAGQQYQNANAYDRQKYQQQLEQKAALQQSSAQNIYGALDSAGSVATSFLMPQKPLFDPLSQGGGIGSAQGSIFGQAPSGGLFSPGQLNAITSGYSRYNNLPK